MRVGSYVLIVGVVSMLGGLLLSATIFQRQSTLDAFAGQVEEASQFQHEALRFSDQIKGLFVLTDLLFGAEETYLLPAAGKQVGAALTILQDIEANRWAQAAEVKPDIEGIRQDVAALRLEIESLEEASRTANFTISAAQLRAVDELSFTLVDRLATLETFSRNNTDTLHAEQEALRAQLVLAMWVLACLYACAGGAILYWATRSVSEPLNHLSESAAKALQQAAPFDPVVGGPAEVRTLSRHIGAFVASLQRKIDEAARMSQELKHQATHDALTGLANRRNLEHALKRAEASNFALCIVDLDRFKLVNDTSGHGAGDALLVQIGRILTDAVRVDDTVVRLGGDEFAILLRDCTLEHAMTIADAIRERIEAHVFPWDDAIHRIGCSIGVKYFDAARSNGLDVMRDADAACYIAKQTGRNRVVLHDADSEDVLRDRGDRKWLQLVNRALDEDLFVLFSQDIISLNDTRRPAQEILLRLQDKGSDRFIAPGSFMPAVERFGLNARVDQWVVTHVLRFAERHPQRQFWINLSGNSLGDERFIAWLLAELKAKQPAPGSINFEITETAVIGNLAQAAKFLAPVQALGCRIALDDFGTGLSSFSYLKSLPVDVLKIDGVFVRDILQDPINKKFVQAIIEIAHTMQIETVAEFVENEDVLAEVRALGANFAQGYAIGKPAPLEADADADAAKADETPQSRGQAREHLVTL